MHSLIAQIKPVDCAAGDRARAYLDTLTKPPGSMGMLEQLAIQLSEISGELAPSITPPGVIVFAADHGVAAEGVSAFPQAVTAQMVTNFANGGAAINVFARQINAHLEVVDVGVVSDVEAPRVIIDKVRRASGNIVTEDAMQPEQAQAAIEVGIRAVERARKAGCRSVIVGEMGIANTTASSAMLAAFTGTAVEKVVGAGTGLNSQQQGHKIEVIERALAARNYEAYEPLSVLAALGGLEIAAMTGAYLAAAAYRLPAIVDGFIASVAALTACRICPAVRGYLVFGHRSEEPGHGVVLDALEATPLLALGMRLGEGSGAALAFPLLQAATVMMAEMATFTSAGIADKTS
ncbi:nicotinate-nucleotide--dimethylbenzimidazole phosphoribosyltransferase [Vreelandella populi]|uniref:Nicotinate-nucleotide--dimethylbenzimidazole phosphoribosyltransferase n=1 Tax=Vreelandella populi TaxID=2498858 RepID=A0A3S0YLY6_9GAMM|nr:nicotinate-nucleotide--dimethylbenzimidazole phosphoribosyltransferase [Halomonas populi]RUR40878.1 nicotinate-nucleotide--dimethylbenzimidazole phosphoribosyltransferase [Halomonas populi]RUR49386.1 nicotinate-nucleotide--dimethylbenzimidazole phosphoribosyltransferase [Halomonas populi]RUR55870.1 nicotinate-nucleotide--dimethylbenzimidazole phosphoribosyltransferase [Halomonas populi]